MRTPRRPIAWPNDARIAILPTIVLETWPADELGKPGSAQAAFRHDFPSGALFNTAVARNTARLYGSRCGPYRVRAVPDAVDVETNGSDILQWWKDQFDQVYEEGEKGRPGLMTMGLHPFIIGRPFRARVLREFLSYASSKKNVWFARGVEAADHYLANYRDLYVETWPSF